MKLRILALLLVLFMIGSGAFYLYEVKRNAAALAQCAATVTIEKIVYCAELADSPQEQNQGLSGHAPLRERSGMLFTFTQKGPRAFWMKDMLFSLDFLWIDGDTIVDITENAPHPKSSTDELPIYRPKSPVDSVFEINAGDIAKYGFKVGQKVQIKKNEQ